MNSKAFLLQSRLTRFENNFSLNSHLGDAGNTPLVSGWHFNWARS